LLKNHYDGNDTHLDEIIKDACEQPHMQPGNDIVQNVSHHQPDQDISGYGTAYQVV
jgi:transposase